MIQGFFNKVWYGKKRIVWCLLYPLSLLYLFVIFIRRQCYALGIFKKYKAPCKIIIVGNLTVGGGGKTPMVIALSKFLMAQGYKLGIICKGYKGTFTHKPVLIDAQHKAKQVGDESIELFNHCDAPIVASQNRVVGVQYLLSKHDCDMIISDDGLTHLALERDLEIIMQKDGYGLGNGSLLPAGPLREPQKALQKNQILVHSKYILNNKTINQQSNYLTIYPLCLVHLKTNKNLSLEEFKNKTVYAVAAIAHPKSFFNVLQQYDIKVIPSAYRDHYTFKNSDFIKMIDYPIIMTQKDSVKCLSIDSDQIYVLKMKSTLTNHLKKSILEHLSS